MPRFINPIPQYILSDGDLAAAGTLTFYELNSDIPLTIYGDNEETTTIANPVFLGDRGEVPNVFFSVSARVVFADASGNQIFDIQPVEAGGGSGGGVSGWSTNITYGQLSIVFGSDSQFYISLKNDNTGNDPAATADDSANWSRLKLFRFWNDQETYQMDDIVLRGAVLYVSRIGDNLANDPALDAGGNWITLYDAALVPFDGATAGLVSTNVKSGLDELKALVDAVTQPYAYRGVLDVSSGDPSLPSSPVNGDFYIIGVGGTITVSENGAAPVSKAVVTGNAIVYNLEETRWDLAPASTNAAAAVSYSNLTSGLTATDVQTAIDLVDGQLDINTAAITALQAVVSGIGTAISYKGQLDVSAGNSALPLDPDGGDLYIISTGGTITVSENGATPAPKAVVPNEQIIYNATLVQWDLLPQADGVFNTLVVGGAATFGGTVALSADPISSLQAATKQYVDGVTRRDLLTGPINPTISGRSYGLAPSATASLPASPLDGDTVMFSSEGNLAENSATINTPGSETIEGDATLTANVNNQNFSLTYRTTGTDWKLSV